MEKFDAGEASAADSAVKSPPCLILERGLPTLHEHLSNPASCRLPNQSCNARSMFIQLCESLDFLHGKGLVARGVSVETAAFFEKSGRWCFTDFASWARQGDEAPLDTPLRYAAPEVCCCICPITFSLSLHVAAGQSVADKHDAKHDAGIRHAASVLALSSIDCG